MKCAFIAMFVSVCKTVNQFFHEILSPSHLTESTGLPFSSHRVIFLTLSCLGQILTYSSSSMTFEEALCFP